MVSFATYNILHPYYAVKWAEKAGLNEAGQAQAANVLRASTTASEPYTWKLYSNWDERCPKVARNIQLADIICLQEISRETLENLRYLTKREIAVSAYHSSSDPIQEYGNAILYRAKKASVVESFEIVHQAGEWTRSAACAIFKIDGRLIEVASIHLTGYFSRESDLEKKQKAKEGGYRELLTYVAGLEERENIDGIVIGGDFNEDQSEAGFDLYRPGYLEGKGYRFDGNFAVTEPFKERRIDWLCYKPLDGREAALMPLQLESHQEPASDHLMTGTVAHWENYSK